MLHNDNLKLLGIEKNRITIMGFVPANKYMARFYILIVWRSFRENPSICDIFFLSFISPPQKLVTWLSGYKEIVLLKVAAVFLSHLKYLIIFVVINHDTEGRGRMFLAFFDRKIKVLFVKILVKLFCQSSIHL